MNTALKVFLYVAAGAIGAYVLFTALAVLMLLLRVL